MGQAQAVRCGQELAARGACSPHATGAWLRGQDAAAALPRGKATFRALYDEDGVHPSGAGTYLEACVVASAITGAQPDVPAKCTACDLQALVSMALA